MRRIVAFNRVSADGYFTGPDGNLDWTVPEPELDMRGAGALSGADTILFGRKTYQMFEQFWPRALDESAGGTAAHPHGGGPSPEMRAFAVWINEAAKIVFSRRLEKVAWKNSSLVRELDPRAIEAMKKGRGKDMMIFGSGTIASQLTQHGLIDEYQFVVCPVLLGRGRPLLGDVPKTSRLEIQETKAYPAGNVMLRYAYRQ